MTATALPMHHRYASLPAGKVSVHRNILPYILCSQDQSRNMPSKEPSPIVLLRFRSLRPLIPASLHNMPALWQNSIYGCRWCYFPRICNRSSREYQVFLPDNKRGPMGPDGTSYRNCGSLPEFQKTAFYHPVPARSVLHRKHLQVLLLSSAEVFRDLKAAPVFVSYRHADYTMSSASRFHLNKFYRESFQCSLYLPPYVLNDTAADL